MKWIPTKYFLALLLFAASKNHMLAQLHSFGSNASPKPLTTYKFMAYGYYDLIREAGIGIQYQPGTYFSLDASFFSIRPSAKVQRIIREADYFMFRGAGFSFKPKYHFSRRSNWYIGLGYSVEYIEHKPVNSEIGIKYNYEYAYYNFDECYGYSQSIVVTLGYKRLIDGVCIEPYFSFGQAMTSLQRTTYSSSSPYLGKNQKFPFTVQSNDVYATLNIGIKVGFAFKKNRKQLAINKKFDDVYLPSYSSLRQRYAVIPDKSVKASRALKLAKKLIRVADKQLSKIYKLNYIDTTEMYLQTDKYLENINELLLSGNK